MINKLHINKLYLSAALFVFKLYSNNSSICDIYSKNSQNENLLEFFVFFWTNLWTANAFFFSLLIFLALFFIKLNTVSLCVTSVLFLIYLAEVTSFAFDSFGTKILTASLHNPNVLLLNALNRIHPFILYISAALALNLLNASIGFLLVLRTRNASFLARKTYKHIETLFFWSSSALFLGSWWALQEQTWDGWWDWDSSETLGIGVLVVTVFIVHMSPKFSDLYFRLITKFSLLFMNLMLYFLVQFNFEQTNHNFGIKFVFFFNSFYFLLNLTFLLNILLIFKSLEAMSSRTLSYIVFNLKNSYISKAKPIFFYIYFLLILSLKVFIVSFNLNFSATFFAYARLDLFNTGYYFYSESFTIFLFAVSLLIITIFKLRMILTIVNITHVFVLASILGAESNSLYELRLASAIEQIIYCFFNSVSSTVYLNFEVELNSFDAAIFRIVELLPTIIFEITNYTIKLPSIEARTLIINHNFTSFFNKSGKLELFEVNFVHSIFFCVVALTLSLIRVNLKFYIIKYFKSAVSAHV